MRTCLRCRGVARATESTMDVRAGLRGFDLAFIPHKLFFSGEFELHILRLRRAALLTGLYAALVARTAIRTYPFVLNVTKSSSACHDFSFKSSCLEAVSGRRLGNDTCSPGG